MWRTNIMNNLQSHTYENKISYHQQVELYDIAHELKQAGLPEKFIVEAVRTASEFEGVADLLNLWREESNIQERDEIIADLQRLIEDCMQPGRVELPYVKFNDLETISHDIRAFKDTLLMVVNDKGGITKLAEATGIPQPSLSRFFNSNTVPRRTTLLKIAKALKLDAIQISMPWSY